MAVRVMSRALDDPLEASDEQLVADYQDGDARAVEVLLARYRQLAHIKAHSYFLVGAQKEDIIQEGMIGLYKAIRDYRPDRNASFRTFADICISRQIVSAIKTATRHKHDPLNTRISLSRPVQTEDNQEGSLADVLPDAESDPADLVIQSEEMANVMRAFTRVLSDFEMQVLHLYIEGKSYQEIGRLLSRGVKAIDNALQRIKRKLEMSMKGETAAAV